MYFSSFEINLNYTMAQISLNNSALKLSFFLFFVFVINCISFAQSGRLYQASYNGVEYEYGLNSLPKITISGAPGDIDWNRWAILNDGSDYRLYFMPKGKSDRLYQFGFNEITNSYEYGYRSMPIIPIVGLPQNTNVNSFSILYDGYDYRLYFKSSSNFSLYQCSFDEQKMQYEYGLKSIPEIFITNAPTDIDLGSWSMLFDGSSYRLYFASKKNQFKLYQFSYNGETYEYGYNSTPILNVIGMPLKNYVKKFNITYDGMDYRYYNLEVIY